MSLTLEKRLPQPHLHLTDKKGVKALISANGTLFHHKTLTLIYPDHEFRLSWEVKRLWIEVSQLPSLVSILLLPLDHLALHLKFEVKVNSLTRLDSNKM